MIAISFHHTTILRRSSQYRFFPSITRLSRSRGALSPFAAAAPRPLHHCTAPRLRTSPLLHVSSCCRSVRCGKLRQRRALCASSACLEFGPVASVISYDGFTEVVAALRSFTGAASRRGTDEPTLPLPCPSCPHPSPSFTYPSSSHGRRSSAGGAQGSAAASGSLCPGRHRRHREPSPVPAAPMRAAKPSLGG